MKRMSHLKEEQRMTPTAPEAGCAFVEQAIPPTLARGEQLTSEKKIVTGVAMVGSVSLRSIVLECRRLSASACDGSTGRSPWTDSDHVQPPTSVEETKSMPKLRVMGALSISSEPGHEGG
jgi:hypothetical protein